VAGSDFSEMLWDKTMLGYCNVLSGIFLERDSQIIKKKKSGAGVGDEISNLEPPE